VNRGPCTSSKSSPLPSIANRLIFALAGHDAKDYLVAVAQRERSKLTTQEYTSDPESSDLQHQKLSTLEKFESICSNLPPKASSFSRPTIWHWDIRPDNLFAEDGHITSIIDWQDTWIGPFFLQARRPRLVDHHGEVTLHLQDHYKTRRRKQASQTTWKSRSCCGVTSGRPNSDMKSYTHSSPFLSHRSGKTRWRLPPSWQTARSRLCVAVSSNSNGTSFLLYHSSTPN
jgi:hypothetical protein